MNSSLPFIKLDFSNKGLKSLKEIKIKNGVNHDLQFLLQIHQFLDASCNQLVTTAGIKDFTHLETLFLNSNMIRNIY